MAVRRGRGIELRLRSAVRLHLQAAAARGLTRFVGREIAWVLHRARHIERIVEGIVIAKLHDAPPFSPNGLTTPTLRGGKGSGEPDTMAVL
jgi:hypothetical protein